MVYNKYMDIKSLFPEKLNHSYVIEGDRDDISIEVFNFIKERYGKDTEVLFQTYEAFKINDSRVIHEWNLNKTVENKKRFCIIASKYINHEAERTLLKIIEEPNENTHFFIIVPNSLALLDTILSRVHIVKPQRDNKDGEIKNEAEKFIKMKIKDRFDFVGKVVKSYEDSDGATLRFYVTIFLNFIERFFYKKLKEKKDTKILEILEEINDKRKYLSQPGSSPKMILEHIAIMLE